MEYIRGTTEFQIKEPTVLSLGKFDGLHMGHQLLMEKMQEKQRLGCRTAVFTFDIPPRSLVKGESGQVLTTNREKEYVFSRNGIDYLIEYPFGPGMRSMEPEDFLSMLASKINLAWVVAGRDFHFGHNRRGDYRLLAEQGPAYGFAASIVEKMQYQGRDISSTCIREQIRKGDMALANLLLGYEYFVLGEVVHGRRLGRELGIPTVNQIPAPEKLLPPFGVYVSRVVLDGRSYGGITNVGRKPTIEGENPVGVETHIFDYSGDLYGREIEVQFLRHLRPEKRFASVEALADEMRRNIEQGRRVFAEYKRRKI